MILVAITFKLNILAKYEAFKTSARFSILLSYPKAKYVRMYMAVGVLDITTIFL